MRDSRSPSSLAAAASRYAASDTLESTTTFLPPASRTTMSGRCCPPPSDHLLVEVHVRRHPGQLDHPAQLQLAPPAARLRPPQRGDQRLGLLAELLGAVPGELHLLGELGVRPGPALGRSRGAAARPGRGSPASARPASRRRTAAPAGPRPARSSPPPSARAARPAPAPSGRAPRAVAAAVPRRLRASRYPSTAPITMPASKAKRIMCSSIGAPARTPWVDTRRTGDNG